MLKNEMLRSTHEAAAKELMEKYRELKGDNHDNITFSEAAIEAVKASYSEKSEKYDTAIPATRYIDNFSTQVARSIKLARERDDRAYERISKSPVWFQKQTSSQKKRKIQGYLKEYPNGAHVEEANVLLAELVNKEDHAYFKRTMKYKPNPDSGRREFYGKKFAGKLRKYLERYPEGLHRDEAYALIEAETGEKAPAPIAVVAESATAKADPKVAATPIVTPVVESVEKVEPVIEEAKEITPEPIPSVEKEEVSDPVKMQVETVDSILESAQDDLDANRLLTPPGQNAFDKYKKVLSREKGNTEAQQGLAKISTKYKTWARSALNKEQYAKANTYLDKAEKATPNDPEINNLRQRIAKFDPAAKKDDAEEQDEVTKSLNNGLEAADSFLKGVFGN